MRDWEHSSAVTRFLPAALLPLLAIWTGSLSLYAQANSNPEDLYRRTDYQASLGLLDANSSDAAIQNLIGRDYYMLGDFKRATEHFQKAQQQAPSSSDYALWLGRGWGRRAETSNPLFAAGYASRARQWFEKAVELDGKNQDALSDLFDYYLEAPGFMGGGFDKAQVIAGRIAAADPAEGFFARARLAEQRREYATAEQQLRRAMDAAPSQVGRIVDLAKFLAHQGRTQESDALFAKASTIAPDAPKVWYARADTLIQSKRNLPEAKRLLERYLQASITPDDPPKQDAQRLLKIIVD
jgi:tetratricopeptide (TPR) repeat protein